MWLAEVAICLSLQYILTHHSNIVLAVGRQGVGGGREEEEEGKRE